MLNTLPAGEQPTIEYVAELMSHARAELGILRADPTVEAPYLVDLYQIVNFIAPDDRFGLITELLVEDQGTMDDPYDLVEQYASTLPLTEQSVGHLIARALEGAAKQYAVETVRELYKLRATNPRRIAFDLLVAELGLTEAVEEICGPEPT